MKCIKNLFFVSKLGRVSYSSNKLLINKSAKLIDKYKGKSRPILCKILRLAEFIIASIRA